MKLMFKIVTIGAALAAAFSLVSPCASAGGPAAASHAPLVRLNELGFFAGREYFVLRSGRAKLILQADRADLGPAFTWIMVDAQEGIQGRKKESAFNFSPETGFAGSALTVELGKFPFTALGITTETRWIMNDGVPTVEAVWWAGGIRVTEHISAIVGAGAFRRTIRLESADLMGRDEANVWLGLPSGAALRNGGILQWQCAGARIAVCFPGNDSVRAGTGDGSAGIGPIVLSPSQSVTIETLIVAQIPGGDEAGFTRRIRLLGNSAREPASAQTRRYWDETSSVVTDDRTIRELFDKARFGLPAMVADDGTMDAGIFEYGHQWVRDSSNTALGLLQAGHFELARAALHHVITQMIRDDGTPMMSGGFRPPDEEELDQAGELLHALREYRDWTGDESLVREHRDRLLTVIERPLGPRYLDASGMVHDRKEYWEVTVDDGYELAYQTYAILGLRDASELAPLLGAEDRVARWRAVADRMEAAMLSHPTLSLIADGHLIKRRDMAAKCVDEFSDYHGYIPDSPSVTEVHRILEPDASEALPIALGLVNPHSPLARSTLDRLEGLWNRRWSFGGYDRYNTSRAPDAPGPFMFPTMFILRAQHAAGLFDRSRRGLEWMNSVQGGRAGAWLEEIPITRGYEFRCGIIPWTSAEVALFVVEDYLGVRFDHQGVQIHPALFPGSPAVRADLRFRQGRLRLLVRGSGPIEDARVDGKPLSIGTDGSVRLPRDFVTGEVMIRCQDK